MLPLLVHIRCSNSTDRGMQEAGTEVVDRLRWFARIEELLGPGTKSKKTKSKKTKKIGDTELSESPVEGGPKEEAGQGHRRKRRRLWMRESS